ncbi:MAG: hypothetical protein J6Y78_11525 [Paludibacteraceae bacterium]|nr:hypothetical protein [Paludibacteraceae bacterium]
MRRTMEQDELKKYLIGRIEDNFKELLEIFQTYYKLTGLREYTLYLRMFYEDDGSDRSTPRIWVISDKTSMAIELRLFSIDLDWIDSSLCNNYAMDVFMEYQKYFFENNDLFKVKDKDGDEWKVVLNFKIAKEKW